MIGWVGVYRLSSMTRTINICKTQGENRLLSNDFEELRMTREDEDVDTAMNAQNAASPCHPI